MIDNEKFKEQYKRLPIGDDVEIFVLSKSNTRNHPTLKALQDGGCAEDRAVLVVPFDQGKAYLPIARKYRLKRILRVNDATRGTMRRAAAETAEKKFLTLDDDLTFYKRPYGKATRQDLTQHDMKALLILISRLLAEFPSVGIAHCPYKNNKSSFEVNAHTEFAVAYQKSAFLKAHSHNENEVRLSLQLAMLGYENAVITEYEIRSPRAPTDPIIRNLRKCYERALDNLMGVKS